jgi:hypothetical protein
MPCVSREEALFLHRKPQEVAPLIKVMLMLLRGPIQPCSDPKDPIQFQEQEELSKMSYTTIQYRDFYDVPRIFVARSTNETFLFDSRFDDLKDEYDTEYTVFLMPMLSDGELTGDWKSLKERAIRLLGTIPVSEVQFDSTKRKQVDLNILGKLRL